MKTNLSRIIAASRRATKRGLKYANQRRRMNSRQALPFFICGCQRSGTNMLLDVLDRSPDTWVYNEDHRAAFDNYRIKAFGIRQTLLSKAGCSFVVFKCLADSQNADQLLKEHPGSKAIWIYRGYQDVANSAVRKWGQGQKSLIRLLVSEEGWRHWLVEGTPSDRRELVRQLYSDETSPHTAAALKWYLRNVIYLDHRLEHHDEQVRLVRYERLVSNPVQ